MGLETASYDFYGSKDVGGNPAQVTNTGYVSAQSTTYVAPQSQKVREFQKDYEPQPPTLDKKPQHRVSAEIEIFKIGLDSDGNISYDGFSSSGFDSPVYGIISESEEKTVSEPRPVDLKGGVINEDAHYNKNTLTVKIGFFIRKSYSEQTITRNGAVVEKGNASGFSVGAIFNYKGIGFGAEYEYMGPYK